MTRRKQKKQDPRLTYRGVTYRSLLEVDVVKKLYQAKRKLPFKFSFEAEGIPYVLPERVYVPDFTIKRNDGSVIYIEVKGYLDNDAMRKMKAVKTSNPDKTFVFLFAKDNPVRKGAKMRYSDWCEKHGFDYAIQEIPEKWLIN